MGFKIIDGKAYEVKEVDLESLKMEVNEILVEIESQVSKKAQIEASVENTSHQFDGQIENYKKQIEALKELVNSVEEKKSASIAPHLLEIDACEKSISEAKLKLEDRKEIISTLLPEESKKLGF